MEAVIHMSRFACDCSLYWSYPTAWYFLDVKEQSELDWTSYSFNNLAVTDVDILNIDKSACVHAETC